MSNNYEVPQSVGGSGGLINTGTTLIPPASGSADASLFTQQQKYLGLTTAYIASAGRVRADGKDLTREIQSYLSNLVTYANYPMTAAQANTYFPGTTASYWNSQVIDFLAAYNGVIAAQF